MQKKFVQKMTNYTFLKSPWPCRFKYRSLGQTPHSDLKVLSSQAKIYEKFANYFLKTIQYNAKRELVDLCRLRLLVHSRNGSTYLQSLIPFRTNRSLLPKKSGTPFYWLIKVHIYNIWYLYIDSSLKICKKWKFE